MSDARKNFAISAVAAPPSPPVSGTTLTVGSGEGARFPAVPFNAVVAPTGLDATPDNAEIVRVTNIATDTFTIVRAQEGSTARTIHAADRIYAGPTKKMLDDIETAGGAVTSVFGRAGIVAATSGDYSIGQVSGAGTAASLDVPSSGDASAAQVVKGSDTRLTNARTPTAHHATHEPGGTDAMATDAVAATASLRTLGSGAQQAVAGNDSRLSDSRAPSGAAGGSLAGTYPNPSIAAGAIGGTEIASAIKDPVAATAGLRTLGTGSQQATAGNDSRLSDSRAPNGAASGALSGSFPGPELRDVLQFRPETYDANAGDGKKITDAVMSSVTNPTHLTSATANFVAGDVGKAIGVAGAGVSGDSLCTTITSRVSATEVILGVAASTTVSGATAIYGTDSTTGITGATDAAYNAVGAIGTAVLNPSKIYVVNSAPRTDRGGNAIIALPAADPAKRGAGSIQIKGGGTATQNPENFEEQARIVVVRNTDTYSATNGVPCVIGGKNTLRSDSFPSYGDIVMTDVKIEVIGDPTITAIDVSQASGFQPMRVYTRGFAGEANFYPASKIATHAWAAGIIWPQSPALYGNTIGDQVWAQYFYAGQILPPGQHGMLRGVWSQDCRIAYGLTAGSGHPSVWTYVNSSGGKYHIAGWDPEVGAYSIGSVASAKGSFTVTIASPAVFTKTAHGLSAGDTVVFSTTGALPTGLRAGRPYFVIAAGLTADNFEVSLTSGGAAVNTSGTQSGSHTIGCDDFQVTGIWNMEDHVSPLDTTYHILDAYNKIYGDLTFLRWDGLAVSDQLTVSGAANLRLRSLRESFFRQRLAAGDAQPSWWVDKDGKTSWGPGGSTAVDTNLYRSAAATLKTNSAFVVAGLLTAQAAITVLSITGSAFSALQAAAQPIIANKLVLGDANDSFHSLGSGKHEWGAGGATAVDTNLYRGAADQLKTDDALVVTHTSGITSSGPMTVLSVSGVSAYAAVQVAADKVLKNKLGLFDTNEAFNILGDGKHQWGAGGAGALDTNLYRSAAAVLKTDHSLHVLLDFRHLGTNLGFYNVAAVARPTAYTQTYATATRTHSNPTAVAPPAGGTGATAGAYDTAAHRDSMITSVTNLVTDVANVKQVLNSVIDDLQANGLLQ